MKRKLLYFGYFVIKKLGFLYLANRFSNYASILMFHRVNDYDSGPLTTPTVVFEKIIETISKNYRAISLPSLIRIIKNNERLAPKTVVITFDDGYKDNYIYAAPILQRYGMPATFFITSGYIDTDKVFPWDMQSNVQHPLMTWEEVNKLSQDGFDIGAHTENHVILGEISLEKAKSDVVNSKRRIENEINKRVQTFAYPFGRKNCIRADVIPIIREAGFDCCCAGYGGKITSKSDLYNLYRIPAYPSVIETMMELDNFMTYFDGKMSINMFISYILNAKR